MTTQQMRHLLTTQATKTNKSSPFRKIENAALLARRFFVSNARYADKATLSFEAIGGVFVWPSRIMFPKLTLERSPI